MSHNRPTSLSDLSGMSVVLARIVHYLSDRDLFNLVESGPTVFNMFDQIPPSVWMARASHNQQYIFRQLGKKLRPNCLQAYMNLLSNYNELLKGFGNIEKVINFTSGEFLSYA